MPLLPKLPLLKLPKKLPLNKRNGIPDRPQGRSGLNPECVRNITGNEVYRMINHRIRTA